MKYSVLVVDDEYDQRRALIEMVNWEAAGFQVTGEAENGADALDMVETLEPDLILTDIRMPMISGLELAAKVREMRPATQIVILSGYDSFEYAQTAINYNIIMYLLKPISSSELSETLFEIHRRMDKKLGGMLSLPDPDTESRLHRLAVNELLFPLMLGGNEHQPDDSELFSKAEKLGILADRKKARFCVLVSKFKNENGKSCTGTEHGEFVNKIVSKYMHCETFIAYGRAVTLAITEGEQELSNLLELPLKETVQTAKRLLNQVCTIGVSREFSVLSHCADAYMQAVTARRYTSDGTGEIRFIDDQERDGNLEIDHVEKETSTLEQLLKVGNREDISSFVDGLYAENTPEDTSLLVIQMIATVYRVVGAVSGNEGLSELLSSNPIFSKITSYCTENVMRNELLSFCENAKTLISQSQRRDSEVICDRVVRIIEERYSDENLSLSAVSNELAISPNYLSSLIKKTKKKNFITLLTERRMKAAYDMLVCSGMKVLDIAEKCGYSDQRYFSYCFKKFYGETPNKVRNSNRSESV